MELNVSKSAAELQKFGPIIEIAIGHPNLEFAEALSVGLELPTPRRVRALIDTGAGVTIINPELALSCKLHFTGHARIQAVDHSGLYPEYAAAIHFPGNTLKSFDVIRVVACPLASQQMSCLIGRDILRHWELIYNGHTGKIKIREVG